jgi:hypothetical protein
MKIEKTELLDNERKALVEQLMIALDRLDHAGEAMAALYLDMALNVLDPMRNQGPLNGSASSSLIGE